MKEGLWVPDSTRVLGYAGFVCDYCGKAIKRGEYYYSLVLSKEKFVKKKDSAEVVPKKAVQLSMWCKECYKKLFGLR